MIKAEAFLLGNPPPLQQPGKWSSWPPCICPMPVAMEPHSAVYSTSLASSSLEKAALGTESHQQSMTYHFLGGWGM